MPIKQIVNVPGGSRHDFVKFKEEGRHATGFVKIGLGDRQKFDKFGVLKDIKPKSFFRCPINRKEIFVIFQDYGVAILPAFLLKERPKDANKPKPALFTIMRYLKDESGKGTYGTSNPVDCSHVDAFVSTACAPRGIMKNEIYLFVRVPKRWINDEVH